MSFFTYNQSQVTVLYDGIPLTDLGESACIKLTVDGGEVQKTEGTDGAGINIGTLQGATCKITFKETSPSLSILDSYVMAQQFGGLGGTLTLLTGTLALHTLAPAFISTPGELSTGDKKMGAKEYTFISANYNPAG
jgi:hypothetical protein